MLDTFFLIKLHFITQPSLSKQVPDCVCFGCEAILGRHRDK